MLQKLKTLIGLGRRSSLRPPVPTGETGIAVKLMNPEDPNLSSTNYDHDIDDAMSRLGKMAEKSEKNAEFRATNELSQTELDSKIQSIFDQHPNDEKKVMIIQIAGEYFQRGEKNIAAGLWRKAAKDSSTAAYSYGMCLQQGHGIPAAEPTKAARMFASAARKGHPWAQYALAQAFHSGTGVKEDHKEALNLFEIAAQNGIPPAPFNVANMYAAGQGTPMDEEVAVEWYIRAADIGDPKALFALGSRYCSGRGVEEDWDQGYKYHLEAAEAGYAPAQFNTATHYFAGQGVDQDFEVAAEWFQRAAEQGLSQAQFNLAQMYFGGRGVEKNQQRGIELMEQAVLEGNNEDAKQVLIDIEKEKYEKREQAASKLE